MTGISTVCQDVKSPEALLDLLNTILNCRVRGEVARRRDRTMQLPNYRIQFLATATYEYNCNSFS